MAEREPFLSRWARRKAASRGADLADAAEPGPQVPADEAAGEAPSEEAVDLSDLPAIDELDLTSDFAAFMRPGVPDALRTQALRKLWTLDPAFSRLDGLVDYGEDYAAALRGEHVVRTAWRLGKGMPDPKENDSEDAEEVAEASEQDAPCESDTSSESETTT